MAVAAPMTTSIGSPITGATPPAQQGILLAAWADYKAGFRGQSLLNILAIQGSESGWDNNALNNNPATGDYSVGLSQINYYGSLAPGRTRQFGPPRALQGNTPQAALANASAAFAVSGGGTNFSPWTTWTSGSYKAHVGQAQAALEGVDTTGTQTGAAALTSANTTGVTQTSDCIISLPSLGPIGGGCLLGSHQARAVLGALLVGSAVLLSMAGLALVTGALLGRDIGAIGAAVPGPVGSVVGIVARPAANRRERRAERQGEENRAGSRSAGFNSRGEFTGKRVTVEGGGDPF